jgi:hypothetical protein
MDVVTNRLACVLWTVLVQLVGAATYSVADSAETQVSPAHHLSATCVTGKPPSVENIHTPTNGKELLTAIKSTVDNKLFLDGCFYDDLLLKRFFGGSGVNRYFDVHEDGDATEEIVDIYKGTNPPDEQVAYFLLRVRVTFTERRIKHAEVELYTAHSPFDAPTLREVKTALGPGGIERHENLTDGGQGISLTYAGSIQGETSITLLSFPNTPNAKLIDELVKIDATQ